MPPPMLPPDPRRSYDAVLCDVDGCLTSEGNEAFPLHRLAAVANYNEAALRDGDRPVVTLCTGRPVPFADCLSKAIHNLVLPVIAENGVWLYHAGLNDWRLDPAITPEHLDAVRQLGEVLLARWADDGLRLQPGKTASVSPYHSDPDFLRAIEPEIRQLCQERHYPFRISSTWHYINCDLHFVSKASGIRRWKAWTGIPGERLAGIGDTAGDLAIAESVATFGAPANRSPVLDSHLNHLASAPEIEGVLELLHLWISPVGSAEVLR